MVKCSILWCRLVLLLALASSQSETPAKTFRFVLNRGKTELHNLLDFWAVSLLGRFILTSCSGDTTGSGKNLPRGDTDNNKPSL